MIYVMIDRKGGPRIAGTREVAEIEEIEEEWLDSDTLVLKDPAMISLNQTPIEQDGMYFNRVTGEPVPPNVAQQIGPQNLKLRWDVAAYAFDIERTMISTADITEIREMTRQEKEAYLEGRKNLNEGSTTGLITKAKPLPKIDMGGGSE